MTSNKNILVSGWPGVGVSTVVLLLSYIMNRKLLRGTESFRYIWRELGVAEKGAEAADIEKIVQPYFGKIYDKYIDHVLSNPQAIILESDIGGFRLGKKETYSSIFLIGTEKIRFKRLSGDGRPEDAKIREEQLRIEYKKLHGFDWFDEELVHEKYNFVLDNTKLSIEEEMSSILNYLEDYFGKFDVDLKELESNYWESGKEYFVEELSKKNLISSAAETIRNIRELFSEEIEEFPENLKTIIKNT